MAAPRNRRRPPPGIGPLPDPVVLWWYWPLAFIVGLALCIDVP